jgi:hypothetical protein
MTAFAGIGGFVTCGSATPVVALEGDHQMFSLTSSKATATHQHQLDPSGRLNRRTTRSGKIITLASAARRGQFVCDCG